MRDGHAVIDATALIGVRATIPAAGDGDLSDSLTSSMSIVHRRRPRRLRSGRGGGAGWRAHRAGHAAPRHDRRDVLQSGDRRARQGPSGARDRRARRPDGPRRRRRRHPVPRPQPPQGAGGAGPARPGRPQALPPGDATAARARPPISRVIEGRGAAASRSSTGAIRGARTGRRPRASPAARWWSPPARSCSGVIHLGEQPHPGRPGRRRAVDRACPLAWPTPASRSAG